MAPRSAEFTTSPSQMSARGPSPLTVGRQAGRILIRIEQPGRSSRKISQQLFIARVADITRPNNGRGIDIRRIVDPFLPESVMRTVTDEDQVRGTHPLESCDQGRTARYT